MTPARSRPELLVIGGGLAGPEAAWQAARAGLRVELVEMRPARSTPAHRTASLAELVCSNSLKSEAPASAPWQLKRELRRAGSLLLECADRAAIAGGQALTVDRARFSAAVEAAIAAHPRIELRRAEVTRLPGTGVAVIATGPLTSPALAAELAQAAGAGHLYFYDAISPVVEAASVRHDLAFAGSRYRHGGDDYLNCPLTQAEFEDFYRALRAAESYPLHAFEEPRYFEACLPLEELARRGPDTLRFGPMKPVGLADPRTGKLAHAVVQLRREDARAGSYNLVGCQNHMRWAAQAEVFRRIPALQQARFLRYGQVHRNTYLDAPATLAPNLALRRRPDVFVAGQLCGTEGYVEAVATGLVAGMLAAARVRGHALAPPPRASALGSLLHYISQGAGVGRGYEPANMTFDLLPPDCGDIRDRQRRHERQCNHAFSAMEAWLTHVPWVDGAAGTAAPEPAAAPPAAELEPA